MDLEKTLPTDANDVEEKGIEVLMRVADNNPGAIRVLTELMAISPLFVSVVDANKIVGPDLWDLYKYTARENPMALAAHLASLPLPDEAAGAKAVLKDGTEMPVAQMVMTVTILSHLMKADPIGAYELREKSRNPDHPFFGLSQAKLAALGLLDKDGQPPEFIRRIANNAFEGEMLEMRLTSPAKPE